MSNAPQLVQKHWNYCNILRDDDLSYGDYVEQIRIATDKASLLRLRCEMETRLTQSHTHDEQLLSVTLRQLLAA